MKTFLTAIAAAAVTFATLGAGQIPYWGALLFTSMAKIEAVEVVYKNPADMVSDIMSPAGMNPEVVQILNKAVVRALAAPDLRERMHKTGYVPTASSPVELRKRYEDWMAIFGKIARDTGIKPQ